MTKVEGRSDMQPSHVAGGVQDELPDLSTADWLAILLAADNSSPILGRTAFVKQLFVLGKEVVPQIDLKFKFFPSRYGPYSKRFLPSVRELVRRGLVTEERAEAASTDLEGVTRFDYYLTPDGVSAANEIVPTLPPGFAARITDYKRTLGGLGFWGLIHYVYANYPEYTVASEILGQEGPRRSTG